MSVRRLAQDSVQPAAFAFTSANAEWAMRTIARYPAGRQQSAVIPLLMRAQDQEGWVSRAAIERVADILGMAYIRVLEIATFYTQFQLQPVGTLAHIQVCGTTPCMLRGSDALFDVCRSRIHAEPHHTNADGTLSWEEVECLGACVNAPMVAIGRDTYEDLTAERFAEIVDAFASGQGGQVAPGSQIGRMFAAPEGGPVVLTAANDAARKPAPPDSAAAPPQAPTAAGRPQVVTEEAAPAIKGPSNSAKVSEATAEAARGAVDRAAKANGAPNAAMREGATGAESPAGKVDGGARAGKRTPRRLFDTPAGAADDLKLITGIGPVLERTLNAVGITTWAQVAALTPDQISAVEAELAFRGRIARDRWLEQARALAAGGIDEYRRVFGKDPR